MKQSFAQYGFTVILWLLGQSPLGRMGLETVDVESIDCIGIFYSDAYVGIHQVTHLNKAGMLSKAKVLLMMSLMKIRVPRWEGSFTLGTVGAH